MLNIRKHLFIKLSNNLRRCFYAKAFFCAHFKAATWRILDVQYEFSLAAKVVRVICKLLSLALALKLNSNVFIHLN